MARVNVIFHSIHGHVWKMAEAEAAGAREVGGVEVKVYQVQETLSPEIIRKMKAEEEKAQFAHIPVATVDTMLEADAFIFGTGTRYGNMTAQMKTYFDAMGGIWVKDLLVGKVAGVFTSTGTQHGGQETTIISSMQVLLHLGMILVGCPYSEKRQMAVDQITGGSPYGASCVANVPGSPTENELAIARFHGRHIAEVAKKMFG